MSEHQESLFSQKYLCSGLNGLGSTNSGVLTNEEGTPAQVKPIFNFYLRNCKFPIQIKNDTLPVLPVQVFWNRSVPPPVFDVVNVIRRGVCSHEDIISCFSNWSVDRVLCCLEHGRRAGVIYRNSEGWSVCK